MILSAIYLMLSVNKTWNLSNIYKIDMPVAFIKKQANKFLQKKEILSPDKQLASLSDLLMLSSYSRQKNFQFRQFSEIWPFMATSTFSHESFLFANFV